MVKNTSTKSKSQVSGQGGGSWASLDKLKGNTCRDNNLNHAYMMLNFMWVTTSDPGVITDSYLKSSAHCAVASKKIINKMLWIIWRDTVKRTGVVLPLHKPLACPHLVWGPVLVWGRLQQLGKGNWYDKGDGAAALHKERVQGFRLPSLRRRKLKRDYCFKVYKNMEAVDKLRELQFAKCCRTISRGNW